MIDKRNNLIIFVGFPFTIRDKERFGVEYLSSNGYNIFIFDFTSIFFGKQKKMVYIPDEINESYVYKIKTFNDFKDKLNIIKGRKIVLTYKYQFLGMGKYRRLLHEQSVPVYLFGGGNHPGDYRPIRSTKSRIKKIKRYIFDPVRVFRILLHKIFKQKPVLPKKIFVNCNKSYEGHCSVFGTIDHVVVPVHTLDFDIYVKAKSKDLTNDNTCVFLDENVGINHDEQISGKAPNRLSLDAYYASMNRFIDHVESVTGLSVVIAQSPRSEYSKKLDIFGGRPIIKYKTAELVGKSSLVILHSSTAFNYAVLFKKPVVFATTNELSDINRTPSYVFTSAIADAVGQKVINIDSPSEVQSIDFSSLNCNEELYERYIQDYISYGRNDETYFWEIVHRTIIEDSDSSMISVN